MKHIKEYFPLIVSVFVMLVISFVAMPVIAGNHDDHNRNEGSGSKTPMPEVQGEKNPMSKWPAFYDCGPSQIIHELIKRNGEMPMVESIGVLQIPGDTPQSPPRMMQAPITQYFNGKTGTYTIVSNFQNGYSCILLFGHGLKPAGGVSTSMPPGEWKKKLKEPEKVKPNDIKRIDNGTEQMAILTNW